MPLLGFGVYQNYNTKPSVLEAFQAGYRHIDSAQAYRNESAVGEAVRDSGIPRGELFITTKCASKTHGYDSTLKGVDESLARFGFDYIDLFLIHDPFSGAERRLDTYRALLDAQKAGKIRTVGVSNYGIKHLDEIKTAGLPMPSVNQIEVRVSSRHIRDYHVLHTSRFIPCASSAQLWSTAVPMPSWYRPIVPSSEGKWAIWRSRQSQTSTEEIRLKYLSDGPCRMDLCLFPNLRRLAESVLMRPCTISS